MNKKGFTLIELVLVITILGIIAVSALPSFTSVTTQAEQASRDTVTGALEAGLQLYKANDIVVNGPPGIYPPSLDVIPTNTVCDPLNPCFGNVLQSPIGDYKNGRGWFKVSDSSYTFNDGTSSFVYTYNSASGTFTR